MTQKKWLALTAAVFALAGGATAQTGERFFAGIMAPRINLGGSHFNGDNYFDLGTEYIFIPKIDSAWGWGIVVGVGKGEFDGEIYYMQSKHNAYVVTIPERASFSAIGIDWRWYFMKPGIVRPYINIAIDFSSLTVTKAAVRSTSPYSEGDAKFRGLGICGGGGLAVSPIKRITLFAGAEIRWNPMGQVKGLGEDFEKTKDLASFGLGFRTGSVFRF